MHELSVRELAQWIASNRDFILLDVREPREVQIAALPGSTHIPMTQLPARVNELDKSAEIAVLCHYGGRSERVATFLTQRGFTNVHNVEGGIDEYALQVDPSLVRY